MKPKNRTWRTLPALLGLLAGAGLAGCHPQAAAPAGPPAPTVEGNTINFASGAPQLAFITAEPVEARKLAVSHLTGRLYWSDDNTVRIFTPVAGQVEKVSADVGQAVRAGAALAEIQSPDFDQARADARTAEANLTVADKGYARSQDLYAHGAIAQKDLEAAEATYQAALAERDRAASRLALYGGTAQGAGEQLYQLRSPLPGTVVEKNINPGQEVRADQMLANATNLFAPLFVVSDPAHLWLQLDIAETDLPSLHAGQALHVYSRAYPGAIFNGRIANIAPTLDPATRTVKVRGEVDNPDGRLKAEMYVTVDVVQGERAGAAGLEISSKAVFMIADQYYLFVETAPGRFERQEVKIGTESDRKVPVYSGLAVGQKVVTEGALLLESILQPAD
jgi:cobalt-zinc-cadmium efflux system membrane fusion protein